MPFRKVLDLDITAHTHRESGQGVTVVPSDGTARERLDPAALGGAGFPDWLCDDVVLQ
jgi:hypothetical protein